MDENLSEKVIGKFLENSRKNSGENSDNLVTEREKCAIVCKIAKKQKGSVK